MYTMYVVFLDADQRRQLTVFGASDLTYTGSFDQWVCLNRNRSETPEHVTTSKPSVIANAYFYSLWIYFGVGTGPIGENTLYYLSSVLPSQNRCDRILYSYHLRQHKL